MQRSSSGTRKGVNAMIHTLESMEDLSQRKRSAAIFKDTFNAQFLIDYPDATAAEIVKAYDNNIAWGKGKRLGDNATEMLKNAKLPSTIRTFNERKDDIAKSKLFLSVAAPAVPVAPQAAPQAEDTAESRARLVKDLVRKKIADVIDAREGERQTQKNIEKGRKMAQNFKARLKAAKPKEAPNADAPKAEAPKAGLKAVIKAVQKAAQKKATPPPSPKAAQKKATPPPSPKAAQKKTTPPPSPKAAQKKTTPPPINEIETKQATRGAPPPITPPGIFPIQPKKFEEDNKEENQLKKITRHNVEKIDDSVKVKPSSTVMPTIEVSDIRRALAKSNNRRFKIGTNVIKYHRLNGIGKTATDFI